MFDLVFFIIINPSVSPFFIWTRHSLHPSSFSPHSSPFIPHPHLLNIVPHPSSLIPCHSSNSSLISNLSYAYLISHPSTLITQHSDDITQHPHIAHVILGYSHDNHTILTYHSPPPYLLYHLPLHPCVAN